MTVHHLLMSTKGCTTIGIVTNTIINTEKFILCHSLPLYSFKYKTIHTCTKTLIYIQESFQSLHKTSHTFIQKSTHFSSITYIPRCQKSHTLIRCPYIPHRTAMPNGEHFLPDGPRGRYARRRPVRTHLASLLITEFRAGATLADL